MSNVKTKEVSFRYPKEMPEKVKRDISVKSGYIANKSLRIGHEVVYRNLLRKFSVEGATNTTRKAMKELSTKYPDLYQEFRLKAQGELVSKWQDSLEAIADRESKEYTPGQEVEVSSEDLKEALEADDYPRNFPIRQGLFSRLRSIVGL